MKFGNWIVPQLATVSAPKHTSRWQWVGELCPALLNQKNEHRDRQAAQEQGSGFIEAATPTEASALAARVVAAASVRPGIVP
jgi:hypothetical protein